jgi:hypothetical protein
MGDNDIRIKYCREIEGGPRPYLFYLEDDITVALGRDRPPRCSCGANEGGRACKVSSRTTADRDKHIFWMLGQLIPPNAPKDQTIQFAEDGSSVKDKHPAEIIERVTLETIAQSKENPWVYQEEGDEDETEVEITNMLSVFEPAQALPHEFRGDFEDEDEDRPIWTEQSDKYARLKDLLVEHAARHPALFIELQGIIPPEFQVQVFFDKINQRIDRAFDALDEYIAHGPDDSSSERLDVENCATKLRTFAKRTAEFYHEQENDTAPSNLAELAVTTLVKILDEVATRDKDAHADITWGPMPSTNPAQSNLAMYLIGATAQDGGRFIVDTLRHLPHENFGQQHELLRNIEESLACAEWTPSSYLEGLRHIIRKRSASPGAEGSARRVRQ